MRQEFEGKTIRCRVCRSIFVVAAGPASPAQSASMPRASEVPPAHPEAPLRRPAGPDDSSDKPIGRHDTGSPHSAGGNPLEQPAIFDDVGDILDRIAAGEQYPAALPTPSRSAVSVEGEHPLTQFIAIVAGGVIALPIAQLILWWCLGSDPLLIAPLLPRPLGWMAPDACRE